MKQSFRVCKLFENCGNSISIVGNWKFVKLRGKWNFGNLFEKHFFALEYIRPKCGVLPTSVQVKKLGGSIFSGALFDSIFVYIRMLSVRIIAKLYSWAKRAGWYPPWGSPAGRYAASGWPPTSAGGEVFTPPPQNNIVWFPSDSQSTLSNPTPVPPPFSACAKTTPDKFS